MANPAIEGPIMIATAISAAAFDMSPDMPKTVIPQLAIPNAKTAKMIAIIMPIMLITRSFTEEVGFSVICIPPFRYSRVRTLKTFAPPPAEGAWSGSLGTMAL